MGYHTTFSGKFDLNKKLTDEHAEYLAQFSGTRRMRRNANEASVLPDPIRLAVNLPIGTEGGYFVGGDGFAGQDNDRSVLDNNTPPKGQPSLWCQWIPSDDRKSIFWDGGEKFYDYEIWLDYIIEHFLKPWGYILNGEVYWYGESDDDRGILEVKDNVVRARIGRIVYDD